MEKIEENKRDEIVEQKKKEIVEQKEKEIEKQKEEEEEEEEEEDDEEIEEAEKKEKKELIQLDANLKEHIKDKIFILNDKLKFDFTYLYNKISKKNLLKKLDIFYYDSYAIIPYKNLNYIFYFNLIPVELLFKYEKESENKKIEFSICSSYELLDYCKKNNYNPYIVINNDKYKIKDILTSIYFDKIGNLNKINLVEDYRKYEEYKKGVLPSAYPDDKSQLEPQKLSNYFELFFKFETKSNFEYWESKKRRNLITFILRFKSNTDSYCFKICGPSGIGKSMTLFLISRYYNNFLYYNLKTIRVLKEQNEDIKIQNILTESCKYLDLKKKKREKLSSQTEKNRIFSFFFCLKEIVKFLIESKILSVIILDQFKNDSIDKEEYDKILSLVSNQKDKYVKLLICSSTNDKEIRDECINSWGSQIFFLNQFDIKTQKYYFYIDELYNKNDKNNNNEKGNTSYNRMLTDFNYIPKYRNKFNYLKNEEDNTQKYIEDIKEIKKKVEENLKKLYRIINGQDQSEEIITMKMLESLRYLFLNINEKINYKKLEEFSKICSFKYYIFRFEMNYFIINYSFPFMNEIVNDIIDTHLEEFYQFKRKDEHTGSANADFFELFSGKSLKNRILQLPESQNTICIKVKEIVEMKEFSKNEFENLINNEVYSHLKEYSVKKEDFEEENKEIGKELKERKLLLSLNKIINYNDQSIEYYKLKYLNKLKNEYNIFGNENLGNMSVFINQKNQRGRLLDLAYVYGKKEAKTFIGFQMKAYDEESSHGCKFNSTKDDLKEALQPMIINIKYLMNMNIKFWHYVVIILLDKRKKEGKQYFKKIVETCQKNALEYIFYEPFENRFYDRDFQQIIQFIPNNFSNLDNNIESINPINIMDDLDINQYMNNFSNYMLKNKFTDANYIGEGLISLINKKRKRDKISTISQNDEKKEIEDDLYNILNNIKIKFFFDSIKFVSAYKFLNTINIPTPKVNYFFLTESNKKNIYFIIFNTKKMEKAYYQYNMGLDTNINKEKNEKEIISEVDPYYINKNINKKEKFYAFMI